jgi:hypothetical protein
MANPTLLDVVAAKNTDKVVGLIEENLVYAPEFSVIPARSIRGTSFDTFKRTGLPTVGFRNANEGVTPSKSTLTRGSVLCSILGGAIQCDKAVAQAFEDGSAAFEMIEADGVMKAALQAIGRQVFYGVTTDAKGFPGMKAFTPKATATACVSSGGSDAGVQSSVYAVVFGEKFAQLVLGNEASIDLSDFRDESFLDGEGKLVPGRVGDLTGWIGLALNHADCVKRLCNVGADTETGDTCSDSKLADLLDLFPVGVVPNAIFMSRRSRKQLQKSRTVTLSGQGKDRPNQPIIAPTPQDYEGIPIIATDSILNTDAVE